jgi:hypothetical protein
MSHKKIKVTSTDAAQWNKIVAHARTLGAVSRDDAYAFNAEKPSMVIDNLYIKYSSPTMKTKAGFVAPMKISVQDFMNLSSIYDIDNIGRPVADCTAKVAAARQAIIDTTPALARNMKVVSCSVLTQNDTIFASKGIPALKQLGVDITMLGDKPYILDVASNSADELTTELVSVKAKEDILAGKNSPWARYANQFELVTDVTSSKVLAGAADAE